jgi:predicted DCC family thiol-disulfide oxidoreductase YuxK
MKALSILYDEACGFCCECVAWFQLQETSLPLQFVPRSSAQGNLLRGFVQRTRAQLRSGSGRAEDDELIVIDDSGGVYEGPAAFIMCLWVLPTYEGWAERLATPTMMPYARRLFMSLSKNRARISSLLGLRGEPLNESDMEAALSEPPRCMS